jgi:hypothetical protein
MYKEIKEMGFIKDLVLDYYNLDELVLNNLYDTKQFDLYTDGLDGIVKIEGFIRKRDKKTLVKFNNGSELVCSPGHVLIDSKGDPCCITELNAGDLLYNGIILDSIEYTDEEMDFYDIAVSSDDMIYKMPDGTYHHNTFTVEKILAQKGLSDGDGYFKNTGTVSPIGLFMTLYKYRDQIVVFDDSDSCDGDTIIDTVEYGKIKISELYDKVSEHNDITVTQENRNFVLPSDGINVLSYNNDNDKAEFSKMNYIMKHDVEKEMFQITAGDRQIIVTCNHSCLVVRDGKLIEVTPSEINQLTDYLIVV